MANKVYHGARFVLPLQVLESLLKSIGLPSDAEVRGVQYDFVSDGIEIGILHPGLPAIAPGAISERVVPSLHVEFVEQRPPLDDGELQDIRVERRYRLDFDRVLGAKP